MPIPDNCCYINAEKNLAVVRYLDDLWGRRGYRLVEWVPAWKLFGITLRRGHWQPRAEDAFGVVYKGWANIHKMEPYEA